MKIASISENKNLEKRIAITPEIAKKYLSLGFEVILCKNYGLHLGIIDETYKSLGVKILEEEKEILNTADIIVQLGLLSTEKSTLLKDGQTLIGVLNPYENKDQLDNIIKKKNKYFFFRTFAKNY